MERSPHREEFNIREVDRECVWHPFTQMKTAPFSQVITSAKGVWLYTDKKDKILDGISSWWVNLHGHTHPYISERICEQVRALEHVMFADFTHYPAVELASRILKLLPGAMSKIFYTDNGSTAIEVALKMAIQYWHNKDPLHKRKKVVCFKKSYHGDTFGAMSAAGRNHFNRPFWSYLFDVIAIEAPDTVPFEVSINQLRQALLGEDVACFIFEPLILGSGGMHIYSSRALDALLQMCKEHDVITIADEVMTGFGRTGTLFACDQLKEKPDIICLSKGLTGGFLPLGITACNQRIYDAFLGDTLQTALLHGHSYTANPIACQSAIASLDLLLLESSQKQRAMIEKNHAHFCKKIMTHPRIRRGEFLGTILVVEYKTDERTSYFASLRDRLYSFFLSNRILIRPLGNVLYVMPPYCITEEELCLIYTTIERSLEEVI